MCAPDDPVNDAKWCAPVHGASFQDFLSSIGQTPLTREALEGYSPICAFHSPFQEVARIDSFTSFPEGQLYVTVRSWQLKPLPALQKTSGLPCLINNFSSETTDNSDELYKLQKLF
jgi:hypothetical protein